MLHFIQNDPVKLLRNNPSLTVVFPDGVPSEKFWTDLTPVSVGNRFAL
ncbi:MAG: hypothetical protein AB1349_13330 [Elusimicrobiota bacterium]